MGAEESWCLVYIDGHEVKAKIVHVGRGRYKILEHEGGQYVDRLVDASDVLHCRFS